MAEILVETPPTGLGMIKYTNLYCVLCSYNLTPCVEVMY